MRTLILLIVLAARAASAAGPSVAGLCEAWSSLDAAGPSSAVQGLKLSAGHLELTLASGQAVPVKAGEEVVGLFFKGHGYARYRSAEPLERASLSFNARKASSLKVEADGEALALATDFDELLWLDRGPLPALGAAGGPPMEAAFAAHAARTARVQESPPFHPFVAGRLDAVSERVARAELSGGKQELIWVHDPVIAREERLYAVRSESSIEAEIRKRLFLSLLSAQAIGHSLKEPVLPRFLLTDVEYELTASEGRNAWLTVTETWVPQTAAQGVFALDLDEELWDVDSRGSANQRHTRLTSARLADGTPVSYHHDKDALLVGLPSPVAAGTPVQVRFAIEGDFLIRPQGDSFWNLGLRAWFPQPGLGGQYFTAHGVVKVKKPFVPFAPGKTLKRGEEGEYNVLETRLDKPVQFFSVLAGKYKVHEETRDGLTVRVASYAMENTRAFKKLAGLAFNTIKYYENFLGPFPYTEYDIVEINDYGFGIGPPATLFITSEAFNPVMGEANQLFSEGINERFAHEIAHQWWGTVVKMPSIEEQWITESFAEYCAALALRDGMGKAKYQSLVTRWRSRARDATESASIALANRVAVPSDPRLAFLHRVGLLYNKGPYLLYQLHQELGEERFLTFLKSYQKSFAWKFGSTKTIAGLLQFMTKKDYAPFFQSYYWGTEMPKE